MSSEKAGEDARMEFYRSSAVANYIKMVGIPKRTGQFRDMVASQSKLDLGSKEGIALIRTLGMVRFAKHPQQVNITDLLSGKMITTIAI